MINILAILAAPGMLLPFLFYIKYVNMADLPMYVRDLASLGEKEFFICFSMTVMGLVTVIEWEMLFPDRRDYANLAPLPIRLRTMFGAKIVALLAFLAVFSLAINAFSPIMFPAVVTARGSIASVLVFARCHVVSVLAANTFVFFLCVAVQGLLMNVLGYRAFRRVSPYVQFALVSALILMFLLSGRIVSELQLHQPNSAAVYAFPPLWFLGLYQTQLGWTNQIFRDLAGSARLAVGWTTAAALAAYLLSYKRHVRRSLESADALSAEPSAAGRVMERVLDRLVVRDVLQQASFYFIWKTLTRSRRHKLFFAAYVAVGCALVFEGPGRAGGARRQFLDVSPHSRAAAGAADSVFLYPLRHAACLCRSRRAAGELGVSSLGPRRSPAMSGRRQESHDRVGCFSSVCAAPAAACHTVGLADGPAAYLIRRRRVFVVSGMCY